MPTTITDPQLVNSWDEYYSSQSKAYEPPEVKYSKIKYRHLNDSLQTARQCAPHPNIPSLPPYEEWRKEGLKSLNAYSFTDRTKDFVKEHHRPIAVIALVGLCCLTLLVCMICIKYGVILV